MHEMALAQGILQVVLDAAEDQTVERVRLQVGRLQMVVPDSLRFSFDLLADGTVAAGAALEMEETPARLRCGQCGAESELDPSSFNCRHCGASDIEVMSGDEVVVDSVELANGERISRRYVPLGEIHGEISPEQLEEDAEYDGGHHVH